MIDLVDDLDRTVAAAVAALRDAEHLEWDVAATGLSWTVRSTVEHVADDLFAYAGQIATATPEVQAYVPFEYYADREGDAPCTIHAKRSRGNAGVVQVLDACGGMLTSLARTRSPDVRGWHPDGVSDPEGFAAMGTVETLLHLHDVAAPLGLAWEPDPDVVRRVLVRLFPDAPSDVDPWPTLLWATGRGDLPGRERVTQWRWNATVRD